LKSNWSFDLKKKLHTREYSSETPKIKISVILHSKEYEWDEGNYHSLFFNG
jgi:hypothetical protein